MEIKFVGGKLAFLLIGLTIAAAIFFFPLGFVCFWLFARTADGKKITWSIFIEYIKSLRKKRKKETVTENKGSLKPLKDPKSGWTWKKGEKND